MPDLANIYRLGIKELWSLARDPVMLVLIVYCFTLSIYVAATAVPDSLDKVPIAIVDEDASPMSARIAAGFYLPRFNPPANISLQAVSNVTNSSGSPRSRRATLPEMRASRCHNSRRHSTRLCLGGATPSVCWTRSIQPNGSGWSE